jgi:hypothetical protein
LWSYLAHTEAQEEGLRRQTREGLLQELLAKYFGILFTAINILIHDDTFLYGCETWSLTLRETHGLRVFENRVLRRIFGLKRNEVTGSGENFIMKSLMICTSHPLLCR